MKAAPLYPKVAALLAAATTDDARRALAGFHAEQRKIDTATTTMGSEDIRVASWIHRAVSAESALCILVGAIAGADAEVELRKLLDCGGKIGAEDYHHGPFVRQQAEERAKLKAAA